MNNNFKIGDKVIYNKLNLKANIGDIESSLDKTDKTFRWVWLEFYNNNKHLDGWYPIDSIKHYNIFTRIKDKYLI